MKKVCIYLIFLFSCAFSFAVQEAENVVLKSKELIDCLHKAWNIDLPTSHYILKKFGSILEDATYHSIIDEFICESVALGLDFSGDKIVRPLAHDDGVIQAPAQHVVLFENPWIRVLWGSSQPGEHEKLHFHAWKSVMVIVEPTTYEITYSNGSVETSYWLRGVYVLGVEDPYSCTNIGACADACLRFEVKG